MTAWESGRFAGGFSSPTKVCGLRFTVRRRRHDSRARGVAGHSGEFGVAPKAIDQLHRVQQTLGIPPVGTDGRSTQESLSHGAGVGDMGRASTRKLFILVGVAMSQLGSVPQADACCLTDWLFHRRQQTPTTAYYAPCRHRWPPRPFRRQRPRESVAEKVTARKRSSATYRTSLTERFGNRFR